MLSNQSQGSDHGMKLCNDGVGLNGLAPMKTSMRWRAHLDSRRLGTLWLPTSEQLPDFSARSGSNHQKHFSWHTFNRRTGEERQAQ